MGFNSNIRQQYFDSFRENVHQLIAWGYNDIKIKLNSDTEEEDISGELALAIDKRLNHKSIEKKFRRFAVHNEKPYSSKGERGKRRRKLDVVLEATGTRRLEYVFEAKRLKTNGFPIGEYLGDSGLGCFLQNIYAQEHQEAGMLAYIQDKDIKYWFSQLSGKIGSQLKPISVIPVIQNEWYSIHKRTDNSNIRISHIFLDFK
jgi:hypothetical protein